MSYFIAGIDLKKGSFESDSTLQTEYYELGLELTGSHLLLKLLAYYGLERGVKDWGELSYVEEHTIVTASGREFFYSGLFKNVIDFQTFLKLNILRLKDGRELVGKDFEETDQGEYNIVHLYRLYREYFNFKNIDKNNKELVDTICNFDLIPNLYEKFNLEKPFCCFVFRKRGCHDHRNLNSDLAKELIEFITTKLNLKVYVAGLGAEFLCNNKNIFYVNLREYATLVSHKNCKFNFSTLTGIPHLTYFCGHSNLKNIILDLDDSDFIGNPAIKKFSHKTEFNQCMGKNINFKNIQTDFLRIENGQDAIRNKMYEAL